MLKLLGIPGSKVGSDEIENQNPSITAPNIMDSRGPVLQKKTSCIEEIEKLKIRREERRKKMDDEKAQKKER
jgi:hypothetical protein